MSSEQAVARIHGNATEALRLIHEAMAAAPNVASTPRNRPIQGLFHTFESERVGRVELLVQWLQALE
ncbi:MAG: hypothetical protein ACP5QO_17395 [Clostridia bacterium]